MHWRKHRGGVGGNILKPPIAKIVEERLRLAKTRIASGLVDLGSEVAGQQQDVDPAVVVVVEKQSAPSEVISQASQAGVENAIGERAVAFVAIGIGAVIGKVGLQNVQVAVVVIIGRSHTHARLRLAVFVERGSRSKTP